MQHKTGQFEMKDEGTRRTLVPQRQADFQRGLAHFVAWYNQFRPHSTLEGRTPNEVYLQLRPATRQPRLEPRKRWPRRSPCAVPHTLVAGQPGDQFTLEVDFYGGAPHLPVISLRRAA